MVLIGFTSRECPAKDVLFDRMGPLGDVKGGQRYDLTRCHKALSRRGVRVSQVKRDNEAGIWVGAQ